jgi:hypothetical protein
LLRNIYYFIVKNDFAVATECATHRTTVWFVQITSIAIDFKVENSLNNCDFPFDVVMGTKFQCDKRALRQIEYDSVTLETAHLSYIYRSHVTSSNAATALSDGG